MTGTRRLGPPESTDVPAPHHPAFVLLLLLLAVVVSALGCTKQPKGKVVVIGLDGATWELLEPWMAQGDLPNLARFREGSAWGTMNSVVPFLSPPAWTSAVTGVNPGRHGIFDFQRRLPGQRVIVTETSKSRRSPPVWNLLKGSGRRVAVINIPMTDPPDQVDGVMVAGFPHLDQSGYAWPPEIEERCGEMGYLLDKMEMKIPEGEEPQVLEEIRTTRDIRWDLTRQIYAEEDWDFFWMVFTGVDRIQHLFWKFADPENPHYDEEKAALFGETMRQFWIEQDRILGEFFAMIPEDAWVLILSDHGFGPIHRDLRIGNWLHSEASPVAEENLREVFVLDRSDAMRLYIREPGRDPAGQLEPEERHALREKLAEGLAAYFDPQTGSRPLEAVYRSEEIFVGRHAEKGPALALLPGYAWYVNWGDEDTGFKLPTCGDHTSTLSGWHRMDGMYILRGPGARTGEVEREFNLLDVAPTCLYLLGETLPEDFDGTIMDAALNDAYLQRYRPRMEGRLTEEDRPLTPEERQALKNLPYVGG